MATGARRPDAFRIDEAIEGNLTRLMLVGELDMASCRQLDRRLDELARAGSPNIEIDFSKITFMDSSGLGVLLGARRKFAGEERSLVLTGVHADLMRIFDLTGVARYFEFV
jgi:anti-anti-sigma factor